MPTKHDAVSKIVNDFVEELSAAVERAALQRVQAIFAKQVPGGITIARRPGRPARTSVAKRPLSPARQRSLKLQGQYIAILRRLKGKARARVRGVAQNKGVAEALKVAASM